MKIYKWLYEKNSYRLAKKKLIRAFTAGGIHLTFKNSTKKDIRVFPKIVAMKPNEKTYTFTYTFTLPLGFSPEELRKKEFIFRQVFGKNLELKGDDKTFKLTIFTKQLPTEIEYNFKEIKNVVAKHKLPIVCGQDKYGRWAHFCLTEHPHLLVAGETGSGKSTQLRSIISTLMLMKSPDELHFYLADCKQAEFHMFKKVQHVKCVVSQKHHIIKMLAFVREEMKRRGDLVETFGVNHIDKLPKAHRPPYIIVGIDEIAMIRGDETADELMKDIGFMGRSNGIFLFASLQRPTSDCLDTTVRSQLTNKMGFHVGSAKEAGIIETTGADTLETTGRFILRNHKGLTELQAPYLDEEIADELLSPLMTANTNNPPKDGNPTDITQLPDDLFKDPKDEDDLFGQEDDWSDDDEKA
ncbi:FtsK/SpoIIIE domain-containing protein [Priestia aryabhattai]|uniref:FtsK/SpoIIIE domain-containing protein n=1 Tax=Priestia aryabhattai TaxID=412384 RepID=UPI0035AB6E84